MWNKDTIRDLLNRSDAAVERGIVAIYQRQTSDEQDTETTRHTNMRGFNHSDARKGTYYANWINKGKHLTGHHLVNARRILQKYAGQLAIVANEKEATKKAVEQWEAYDEIRKDMQEVA